MCNWILIVKPPPNAAFVTIKWDLYIELGQEKRNVTTFLFNLVISASVDSINMISLQTLGLFITSYKIYASLAIISSNHKIFSVSAWKKHSKAMYEGLTCSFCWIFNLNNFSNVSGWLITFFTIHSLDCHCFFSQDSLNFTVLLCI